MPEKEIVFGEKEAGKPYKSRYGAYVVLPNEKNEVILVQAPNGAYFLPGGEMRAKKKRSNEN